MPTPIEWCDETFNPWWGCERVSPACAHCYADTFANRLGMDIWDDKRRDGSLAPHAFRFFGDKHWDEPLKWARTLPEKLGRRPRVFCASMADVFEERDELDEHRARLFDLIRLTPQLDWLLLTKRPEAALEQFARIYNYLEYDILEPGNRRGYLPNVWMGVSIENARFTWRADVLRVIPAAVKFISAEPLLGSLYDSHQEGRQVIDTLPPIFERKKKPLDLTGIDWVIIGGESGPKARPFRIEQAREIIAAARSRGYTVSDIPHDPLAGRPDVAVFVKQLGAKPVESMHRVGFGHPGNFDDHPLKLADRKGGDMDEWPVDLRIREFPQSAVPA